VPAERPEVHVSFTEVMDRISQSFEILGVAVLAVGFVVAVFRAALALRRTRSLDMGYVVVRNYFGRSVLFALELLVAADLIRTVAVQPSLENVAVLGLIVLIRTFLSFSLEVEIEGVWPWRRGARKPTVPTAALQGPRNGSPS
jgi:uncharacterized membrane protein